MLVRIEGLRGEVVTALRNLSGAGKVKCRQTEERNVYEYTVLQEGDQDMPRSIFALCASHSWPLLACRSAEGTLEEMFIRLTDTTVGCEKRERENKLIFAGFGMKENYESNI